MTNTEYIDYILQSLEMPLWGRWNVGELISASSDSAVFGMESKRMGRTEAAVLRIVPLTASKAYLTDAQMTAQISHAKQQAEQESELLYRLQSCTHIVTYQDEDMRELVIGGKFEGYAYLIRMESLRALADQIRSQQFICKEENVRRLAADMLQALMYAHRLGIRHGCIRPDRIYLTADGIAKLSGFHAAGHHGIMRALSDSEAYIAPEIFAAKGDGEFTPQSDIYSLGLCLYQLMNGMNLPFEPELDPDATWRQRMDGKPLPKPADASDRFAEIILKACAFAPEQRYQSAEEMLAELMFFGKDRPQTAVQPAPAEQPAVPEMTEAGERAADADAATETEVQPPETVGAPQEAEESTGKPQPERDASEFVTQGDTLIRYQGNAQVISIPQGIAVIGTGAFENCASLQRVILPQGVVHIEENAFANCTALESVQFPASLRMINNNAFLNCTSLRAAEINGILSQIGSSAFEGCSALRSVVLNGPLEKIGHDAFTGCGSLERIEVSAYSYAYKTVGGVLFDYECKYLLRYPAGRDAAEYDVPETVYAIEDGAFYGCAGLRSVRLPRNVKRIGASAFRECTGLSAIEFPEMLETVKASAFQGCKSLTAIRLPARTTYLGSYAFSHCESLESAELSPKMTELSMGVFEYCKKLSFLRLPETVIQIGERAFMGAGLRELFVTYAASRIEKQAFAACTELSIIFLSNRITYIAGDAFEGCSPELTICGIADSLPSQTAEMAGIRFQPVFAAVMQGNQCVLQRYEGSFTHVIIPPDVNVIGDAVFRGCGSVKSLVIPPAVGEIGKSAFEGCANLETLTLTNLLMRAGDGAFAGCNSLRQIRIADMSQQYDPKVQLKIHRNFYKVLRTIREDIAAEYAKKYGIQ